MAKEFNIYLRQHLVECDLIIRSLAYHDGISVTNRLILEAALHNYILQKFAAVQMESYLTSHIDDMLKLCFERLDVSTYLGAEAELEAQGKLYLPDSPIILDTPEIQVMERMMNKVENGIVMAVSPLVTQASSSIGNARLPIVLDGSMADILKRSSLTLFANTYSQSEVTGINKRAFFDPETVIVPDAAIENLCYKLTFEAKAALEITAMVLGTGIYHSLGRWYDGIRVNSKVEKTWAQKYETAEAIIAILQEMTGTLRKILYPEDPTLQILSEVNAGLKRHRLLEELDDMELGDLDDMTLGELDYVELT